MSLNKPIKPAKDIDGVRSEPFEQVTIDVDETFQGAVMERIGARQGELKDMVSDGKGRIRLEYVVPARGLIGFHTEFLTCTSGTGIMHHVFDHYGPAKNNIDNERQRGAMIANAPGKAAAYSLFTLQDRGQLFLGHGAEVYEGMIIGLHSRENDLVVNPTKGKQLTNVRASGTDENLILVAPIKHTLEEALEFINNDELVEVTPDAIRLCKKYLKESERKQHSRG